MSYKFKNMVVFGDSLSDDGSLTPSIISGPEHQYICRYINTNENYTDPLSNSTQYYESNGPIWTTVFNNLINTKTNHVVLQDFAICGATSYNVTGQEFPLYLPAPLNPILPKGSPNGNNIFGPVSPSNNLFFIWVGGNDIGDRDIENPFVSFSNGGINQFNTGVNSQIVANINATISNINSLATGKDNLKVVINLPNLAQFPAIANTVAFYAGEENWFVQAEFPVYQNLIELVNTSSTLLPIKNSVNALVATAISNQCHDYNDLLRDSIASFGKNVVLIEINKLYTDVLAHPAKYNVVNPEWPCYHQYNVTTGTGCEQSFFWDPKHPSGYGHNLIATYNCMSLKVGGYLENTISCHNPALTNGVNTAIEILVIGDLADSKSSFSSSSDLLHIEL